MVNEKCRDNFPITPQMNSVLLLVRSRLNNLFKQYRNRWNSVGNLLIVDERYCGTN
ncbi:hypothetical protein VCHA48O428_280032 [Vibrio chagasii]|nr:hypothetical protein VCHA48O428_280032 [Vibrio chagasii]